MLQCGVGFLMRGAEEVQRCRSPEQAWCPNTLGAP